MTTGNLTWQQAALRVLEEEGKPLRTTDVGELIAQRQYTANVGAAPTQQASVALRTLLKRRDIQQVGKLYALPDVASEAVQSAEAEAEAEYETATNPDRLTVKAYGLYWARSLVNWASGSSLFGEAGGDRVNFADQDGIYLLHNGNEITYVGQTRTQTTVRGLYSRLQDHHRDRRKTDRWDSFSWFGFRPVDDNGGLGQAPQSAELGDVLNLIEAILIEGLMPRLNMQSAPNSKEWLEENQYFQVEDPQLIASRFAALAQVGAALR